MDNKTIHPAAAILPLMVGDEFAALILDIKAHGLRDPIILHPDGSILDGRNRYRACEKAGVEPRFVTWAGPVGTEVAYVISENLHRRHLDASQRAMFFAKFAEALNPPQRAIGENSPMSQERAAELANVDRKTIGAAKMVLQSGNPELVEAVETGKTSVHKAAKEARALTPKQTAERNYRPRRAELRRERGVREVGAKQREQSKYVTTMTDAIEALASLPDPDDFIPLMKVFHSGAGRQSIDLLLGRKIPAIRKWLDDFEEKWSNYVPSRKQDSAA